MTNLLINRFPDCEAMPMAILDKFQPVTLQGVSNIIRGAKVKKKKKKNTHTQTKKR